ncbi:MAG: hypothetical protein ABIO05_08175 [Ferruginibacter sp.]
MLSEEQIKKLQAENDLLHLQLQDVNYIISIREEELEILRAKAKSAISLKSELEGTFHEIDQMQNTLGKKEQLLAGAAKREAAMEDEIIQGINIERSYYDLQDKFTSVSAAFNDTDEQLSQTVRVYKTLADAQRRIAELESMYEIEQEEKELAQYEVEKLKKQMLVLHKGLQ